MQAGVYLVRRNVMSGSGAMKIRKRNRHTAERLELCIGWVRAGDELSLALWMACKR
jgi:hypothetical protein